MAATLSSIPGLSSALPYSLFLPTPSVKTLSYPFFTARRYLQNHIAHLTQRGFDQPPRELYELGPLIQHLGILVSSLFNEDKYLSL